MSSASTSPSLVDSTPPSVHDEAANIMGSPTDVQATNEDEDDIYFDKFSKIFRRFQDQNRKLKTELSIATEKLKACEDTYGNEIKIFKTRRWNLRHSLTVFLSMVLSRIWKSS
jgi:hypothetical protein